MTRPAAALASLCVAGCLSKPPPPASTCASLAPGDDFSGSGPACGSWGLPLAVASTTVRTGGALVVMVDASPGALGGCFTDLVDFTRGAFVELDQALPGGTYTGLKACFGSCETSSQVFELEINTGQLNLSYPACGTSCSNGVLYDPATMRWLRLWPDGAGTVHAQYSADAEGWTDHLTAAYTGDVSQVQLSLVAGSYSGDAGTAKFDDFNTCP